MSTPLLDKNVARALEQHDKLGGDRTLEVVVEPVDEEHFDEVKNFIMTRSSKTRVRSSRVQAKMRVSDLAELAVHESVRTIRCARMHSIS